MSKNNRVSLVGFQRVYEGELTSTNITRHAVNRHQLSRLSSTYFLTLFKGFAVGKVIQINRNFNLALKKCLKNFFFIKLLVLSECFLLSVVAKTHPERMSRFWPLVIGETIIFIMASHIDPLPTIIVKEKLDDEDVLECQKAIYHVVGMESRNEPLPTSSAGTRGKGPKRDEQYKQMWAELENLIRAHVDSSPKHQRVLDCPLKCKKPSDDVKSSPSSTTEAGQETNTDQYYAWKELDRSGISENDGEGKTNQKEDHPLLKNPDSALMILSLKAKVGGQ
eukprot:XP_019930422.1 PREDICTED: protein asunder homolog isoform X1 [Crassostrea gigas]